jgi:hypothetical protein
VVDSQRESTGRCATAKDGKSVTLHGGEPVDQQAIGTTINSQDSVSICPIEQQFAEHNLPFWTIKLQL